MGLNLSIGIVVGLCFILCVGIYVKASGDRLRRSIHHYTDQISTIRAEQYELRTQKHDLLNHVNTIHALVCMREYEELRAYTDRWTHEITKVFDSDDTGHPILCALLQTKQDEAVRRNVTLTYRIERMKSTEISLSPVDLVRIIGNLVDNAVDCAADGEPYQRWVRVEIEADDRKLRIIVINPGNIPKRIASQILKPSFTTKPSHSGYGLSIVQDLAAKLGGSMQFNVKGGHVTFNLEIPWTIQEKSAVMNLIVRT